MQEQAVCCHWHSLFSLHTKIQSNFESKELVSPTAPINFDHLVGLQSIVGCSLIGLPVTLPSAQGYCWLESQYCWIKFLPSTWSYSKQAGTWLVTLLYLPTSAALLCSDWRKGEKKAPTNQQWNHPHIQLILKAQHSSRSNLILQSFSVLQQVREEKNMASLPALDFSRWWWQQGTVGYGEKEEGGTATSSLGKRPHAQVIQYSWIQTADRNNLQVLLQYLLLYKLNCKKITIIIRKLTQKQPTIHTIQVNLCINPDISVWIAFGIIHSALFLTVALYTNLSLGCGNICGSICLTAGYAFLQNNRGVWKKKPM